MKETDSSLPCSLGLSLALEATTNFYVLENIESFLTCFYVGALFLFVVDAALDSAYPYFTFHSLLNSTNLMYILNQIATYIYIYINLSFMKITPSIFTLCQFLTLYYYYYLSLLRFILIIFFIKLLVFFFVKNITTISIYHELFYFFRNVYVYSVF